MATQKLYKPGGEMKLSFTKTGQKTLISGRKVEDVSESLCHAADQ